MNDSENIDKLIATRQENDKALAELALSLRQQSRRLDAVLGIEPAENRPQTVAKESWKNFYVPILCAAVIFFVFIGINLVVQTAPKWLPAVKPAVVEETVDVSLLTPVERQAVKSAINTAVNAEYHPLTGEEIESAADFRDLYTYLVADLPDSPGREKFSEQWAEENKNTPETLQDVKKKYKELAERL